MRGNMAEKIQIIRLSDSKHCSVVCKWFIILWGKIIQHLRVNTATNILSSVAALSCVAAWWSITRRQNFSQVQLFLGWPYFFLSTVCVGEKSERNLKFSFMLSFFLCIQGNTAAQMAGRNERLILNDYHILFSVKVDFLCAYVEQLQQFLLLDFAGQHFELKKVHLKRTVAYSVKAFTSYCIKWHCYYEVSHWLHEFPQHCSLILMLLRWTCFSNFLCALFHDIMYLIFLKYFTEHFFAVTVCNFFVQNVLSCCLHSSTDNCILIKRTCEIKNTIWGLGQGVLTDQLLSTVECLIGFLHGFLHIKTYLLQHLCIS